MRLPISPFRFVSLILPHSESSVAVRIDSESVSVAGTAERIASLQSVVVCAVVRSSTYLRPPVPACKQRSKLNFRFEFTRSYQLNSSLICAWIRFRAGILLCGSFAFGIYRRKKTKATMAFGRSMGSRNRNSWGPTSISMGFQRRVPDEDYAEECTERMMNAQNRQLDPLKEDLADWLNKTLGTEDLNRDNFLESLDNGVILCHLAQIICEYAANAANKGIYKGTVPTVRGKCFERAMRRSFFSRDNMENFIKFCRALGVHDNLLFESDDLVLHNQPRNVILCLLEVARIATQFGVEPPGLVQLEKEIAEEERNNSGGDSGLSSLLSWQFQATPPRPENEIKMKHSNSTSAISAYAAWNGPSMILTPQTSTPISSRPMAVTSGASDGVPSDNTEDDEWSRGSGEDPDLGVVTDVVDSGGSRSHTPGPGGDGPPTTPVTPIARLSELDKKVQSAARLMQRNCNCASGKCNKLNVSKVGEGKYNIAGKNVFIRLLKGRHMMVRVGGGWDTLDHFLLRHDPCQVKVVTRDTNTRPTSASKYLTIRAKYRSPPPREVATRQ